MSFLHRIDILHCYIECVQNVNCELKPLAKSIFLNGIFCAVSLIADNPRAAVEVICSIDGKMI